MITEIVEKFLQFNKEEVEKIAKDDLEMAFISNYIKNNYDCKEYTVHYATTLFLSDDIITDIYLIAINNSIVRYIEIVNERRVYINTGNMDIARQRIVKLLGGWLK